MRHLTIHDRSERIRTAFAQPRELPSLLDELWAAIDQAKDTIDKIVRVRDEVQNRLVDLEVEFDPPKESGYEDQCITAEPRLKEMKGSPYVDRRWKREENSHER